MADNLAPDQLSRSRTIGLVAYNLGLTLVFSLLLYQVIMNAAEADAQKQMRPKTTASTAAKTPVESPAADPAGDSIPSAEDSAATAGTLPEETVSAEETPAETPVPDTRMIAYVLWAISLAGGLGGVLSNLRGVFGFTRDQSYFPAYLELPFYLRPVSGVLCGLFTFFVSSFFSGSLAPGDTAGWQTLQGMFPYVGIAFIAGFASQEFMERLKETAQTLFGVSTSGNTADPAPAVVAAPPAALPENGDEGHESFNAEDSNLESFRKEPSKPPAAPPPVVIAPPVSSRRKAD